MSFQTISFFVLILMFVKSYEVLINSQEKILIKKSIFYFNLQRIWWVKVAR